jgi:hypothetical protein
VRISVERICHLVGDVNRLVGTVLLKQKRALAG